jgi:hypothetical protein
MDRKAPVRSFVSAPFGPTGIVIRVEQARLGTDTLKKSPATETTPGCRTAPDLLTAGPKALRKTQKRSFAAAMGLRSGGLTAGNRPKASMES